MLWLKHTCWGFMIIIMSSLCVLVCVCGCVCCSSRLFVQECVVIFTRLKRFEHDMKYALYVCGTLFYGVVALRLLWLFDKKVYSLLL